MFLTFDDVILTLSDRIKSRTCDTSGKAEGQSDHLQTRSCIQIRRLDSLMTSERHVFEDEISDSRPENVMSDSNSLADNVVYWHHNVVMRRFTIVTGLVLSWVACDLFLHVVSPDAIASLLSFTDVDFRRLHLLTAYSLPILGVVTLALLCGFIRQGNTQLPSMITVCGGLFIIGGALTDIAVTVIHSPDLAMEGNLYLRILLDSEHSLAFVYAYAFITQLLYIALFCGLWIGFLKHRWLIVQSVSSSSPRSILEFIKAATGGAHLSVRQWLLPLRMSEIPLLYHYVWVIAIPIVFGISQFRWYVAMEWLGVVEPDFATRVGVALHGVCSSLVVYLLAVRRMALVMA